MLCELINDIRMSCNIAHSYAHAQAICTHVFADGGKGVTELQICISSCPDLYINYIWVRQKQEASSLQGVDINGGRSSPL